jgi:hypothetical protein
VERDMTKNKPIITVSSFLLICVMYKLLSIDEAITALKTNRLPDDMLERIRKAELKSMN